MKEEWKDIGGFEGRYQISNLGRVLRLPRVNIDSIGRRQRTTKAIMKTSVDSYGYEVLSLYKGGKSFHRKVHRLVAEAFIPNPNNLKHVDHKIENDKLNNTAANLQWMTPADNTIKSKAKRYVMRSPRGVVTYIYNMRKFCRDNDLHHGHMLNTIKGNQSQHKGWTRL